ncbi:hypothetical protein HDU92_003607 [Lobulomyces angularis]|nr:hypothetical protein HDU92_003607 [Lobulomyces angularis]
MQHILKVNHTDKAPAAIGPYSQYPKTMTLVEGGESNIQVQTRQALENLKEVLLASNSKLDNVVKTTVFLKDMNDFAKMNAVYSEFFNTHNPARSAVEVARLPRDVLVEIECVAVANA